MARTYLSLAGRACATRMCHIQMSVWHCSSHMCYSDVSHPTKQQNADNESAHGHDILRELL